MNDAFKSVRNPLDCTDEEYKMIYEILLHRDETELARKDFMEEVKDKYDHIRDINIFNAFENIFEIICEKKCYEAFKDRDVDLSLYLIQINQILLNNRVTSFTKDDLKYFLDSNELCSSPIIEYAVGENPDMMTYEEFICSNNLDYGEEYFRQILDTIYRFFIINIIMIPE
jgi:hypothetical protein